MQAKNRVHIFVQVRRVNGYQHQFKARLIIPLFWKILEPSSNFQHASISKSCSIRQLCILYQSMSLYTYHELFFVLRVSSKQSNRLSCSSNTFPIVMYIFILRPLIFLGRDTPWSLNTNLSFFLNLKPCIL